jgi:hypothetical protein
MTNRTRDEALRDTINFGYQFVSAQKGQSAEEALKRFERLLCDQTLIGDEVNTVLRHLREDLASGRIAI